ncbi:MAG: Dabb family protein [Verrucomicrobiales bacterium]
MIEHTVTFHLKHGPGSPEEKTFLAEAAELAAIPEVVDFTIRRQTSPKLDHTFGISMWFADRADYETYNAHPAHRAFIEKRWLTEVADFQEADFEAL